MKAYKCDVCEQLFEANPRPGIVMTALGRDNEGVTREFELEFCDSCCQDVMEAIKEVTLKKNPKMREQLQKDMEAGDGD